MNTLYQWQEDFQRFRVHHRYDHPLLFLMIDFAKMLFSLLLLLALSAGLWYAGQRLLVGLELAPIAQQPLAAAKTTTVAIQPAIHLPPAGTPSRSAAASQQRPEPSQVPLLVDISSAVAELDKSAPAVVPVEDTSELTVIVPASSRFSDAAPDIWFDENWILAQEPQKWLVQLGSSFDLQFLERFASALPDDQPIAVYRYKRDGQGREEYGLGFGLFDFVADADDVLKQLSGNDKRFSPWIRRVETVQADITGFR